MSQIGIAVTLRRTSEVPPTSAWPPALRC